MRFKRTLSEFLMIFACFISLPTIGFAAPVKVAILPFSIKANGDHADLQKNIAELLSYRLAREGAVEILPSSQAVEAVKSVQGLSGDSLALMTAARLKADYVLYGTVSADTAQTVKIQARMLNVTGGLAPLDFKAKAPDISGVIPPRSITWPIRSMPRPSAPRQLPWRHAPNRWSPQPPKKTTAPQARRLP